MMYQLVPKGFRNVLCAVKKVGICFSALFGLLILLLATFCFSSQSGFLSVLAIMWLVVAIPINIPWMIYQRTCDATVLVEHDGIEVLYKKVSLRKIRWRSINCVQVRNVDGFFYGANSSSQTNTYICLFLNGNSEIPDVSYNKKFYDKNFLMISYQPELYKVIVQKTSNTNMQ